MSLPETGRGIPAVDRGLGIIAGLMAVVGGAAAIGLVAITIVSVFWRYVLRDPIFGIEDLSTMALTVFVAGAIAYGALHRAHVTVNILAGLVGRKVTRLTDVAVRVLGAGISGFAAYGLFTKGACGLPCGAITANMGIVHTPFYYVLGTAFTFYTVLLVYQLIVGLMTWGGTDPNEAEL